MIQKVWGILKHPVSGVIIGALVAALCFFLSRATVEPRFAVSNPELLADKDPDAPKMSILWEGVEVKNVISVQIALWNSGRRYLDNTLISETAPIQIVPSQPIQILSSVPTRTSRDDLQVSMEETENPDGMPPAVTVRIVGDEAFERDDGCMARILYTGSPECEFAVTGRIKGYPSGFQEVKWDNVKAGTKSQLFLKVIIAYAVLSLFPIFLGICRIRQHRISAGIMYLAQGIVFMSMTLVMLFLRCQYLFAPNWMN